VVERIDVALLQIASSVIIMLFVRERYARRGTIKIRELSPSKISTSYTVISWVSSHVRN